MVRYGTLLATPLGVAAGPHTQLSQNIIAAWLCGARYIELKTIQTLDELKVSKPCIDMQDEGYNCEWSQELKIRQSFREYLNAWILIHILHKEMELEGPVGTLFNMSVGYNLDGILQDNVQWFFSQMRDCSAALATARDEIRQIYPAIDSLEIPCTISNHVTLSTMHGCPPEEIDKIGLYLIRDKKLHTTIKLNPTLLGADRLRKILNDNLGFETHVPDAAFDHDLKYPDALKIINSLQQASIEEGTDFSIKLTNTLESLNHKNVFGKDEAMMYMSGRALHPISIALALELQEDFKGVLDLSFAGGADCFNIASILACGLKPVTFCSDLLKPGGYGRLRQSIDHLRTSFASSGATDIESMILGTASDKALNQKEAALANLRQYACRVTTLPAYHRNHLIAPDIKTRRSLGWFDCIHAPCTDTCPTNQDIPDYLYQTASGDFTGALETVFKTNPFPSVTGMVCDHPCQLKCTRINYDDSLQIREIKRYLSDASPFIPQNEKEPASGSAKKPKAAIIGAGPAGLSCGWFLSQAGFEVHCYEEKKIPGGMVSAAIPSFRLTGEAIERDIQRILSSGITLHDDFRVDATRFNDIRATHDVIFIAAGAQRSLPLRIGGIESPGVMDPLDFLFRVKKEEKTTLGHHVVIIGGGNTAMDAARTALRLVGEDGSVTIAYRRTRREMPADQGEIKAVSEEGIKIIELVNPEKVLVQEGQVAGLFCSQNRLDSPVSLDEQSDLRPVPVKIEGSGFVIPCDTIIPAIGQQLAIDFMDTESIKTEKGGYRTRDRSIYIGGDALRGASTAINAIGDGRKAAAEIVADFQPSFKGIHPGETCEKPDKKVDVNSLMRRKSIRIMGKAPAETPIGERKNFNLVIAPLSTQEAQAEAGRCLHCDELCNVCVTVCPNLANFSYAIEPCTFHLQKAIREEDGSLSFQEDRMFMIDQPYQVLNLRDFCNECGNCTTFCPTSGKPFKDKPGLSLSMESFNREEHGFFLSHLPEKEILIYKENRQIKTLYLQQGKYYFETGQVKAILDEKTFRLLDVHFLTPCVKEYHFTFAAEMSIILKGAVAVPF